MAVSFCIVVYGILYIVLLIVAVNCMVVPRVPHALTLDIPGTISFVLTHQRASFVILEIEQAVILKHNTL